MRLVQVRCRACHQVIEAEATMLGVLVSPHQLPDGSDCAADGVVMDHDPFQAPPTLQDVRAERPDDEAQLERLEDEDSGDYLARRGH